MKILIKVYITDFSFFIYFCCEEMLGYFLQKRFINDHLPQVEKFSSGEIFAWTNFLNFTFFANFKIL